MSSREIAERYAIPALGGAPRARGAAAAGNGEDGGPSPSAGTRRQANRVIEELGAQKLMRAIYSERQLQEVLTDFWFNQFNVDARKGPARFLLTGA